MSSNSVLLEARSGLAYWMEEVLEQCTKAEKDFSSGAVHDLRTSLRRCRSLADGIRVFDRDASWKKMRRAGKQLFGSLGALRDTHVMLEWVEKIAPEGDQARKKFIEFLSGQEQLFKKSAAASLQNFDQKQWRVWASRLPARAARVPLDSAVFAHLALERWSEAHALHLRALRNRTNISWHDLRIGIKRFRYTIENFLPRLHELWGADLKEVQDVLGEIHDLDVLWQTALRTKIFASTDERDSWRARVQTVRRERVEDYRAKMVGSASLWRVWREPLPSQEQLRRLGLERLRICASFLDPEPTHSEHVTRLALQLYDGLPTDGVLRGPKQDAYRSILHAAALLHDVGRAKTNQGHHKASARLLRKFTPPLGWSTGELHIAALVARYHHGALPQHTQRKFGSLSQSRQKLVQFLGGILRLACAFDREHDRKISCVRVQSVGPVLTIQAEGYVESTPLAEHLAAARHLLELAYGRPVFVVPFEILPAKEKARAQAA